MAEEKSYSSSVAFYSAVTARAKKEAIERQVPAQRLIREFDFSRLLARVFTGDRAGRWVLKGGQAMLVRVPDPRTTKDIDLLHRRDPSDLDAAVDDLRAALASELDDFYRFEIVKVEEIQANIAQTGVQCRRVTVSVRCGAKPLSSIQIDVAADSCMTDAPVNGSFPAVVVPSVRAPHVALYPVVDHIADKICATHAVYARGRPSSRERDMVDLVLFAVSHSVPGGRLRHAIAMEWTHRKLDGTPRFEPPSSWRGRYPKLARPVPALVDHTSFDVARALLADFLDPVFAGQADSCVWSPASKAWERHPMDTTKGPQ